MQFKNLLLLSGIVMFFTACNGATKQESITLEKVGNYPDITRINRKMILSKDDKFLFVVNQDKPNKIDILDLSDLSKPKLFKEIICSENPKDRVLDYKMTHNGKYLFVSISDKVIIYNIEDLNSIYSVNEINLYSSKSLAITPNDRYLYIVGKNGEYSDSFIKIYDIQNINNIKLIEKFKQDAYLLTISTDGKKLVYGIADKDKHGIKMMDITNPKKIKELDEYTRYFNNRLHFPYSISLSELLFNQNSNILYLVGAEAGVITFDISKNKLEKIDRFSDNSPIHSLQIIKNGNYALMCGYNYKKNLQYINSFSNFNGGILLLCTNLTILNSKDFFINLGLENSGINIYQIKRDKR